MAKHQQKQLKDDERMIEVKREKCHCEQCRGDERDANWQGTAALVLAIISIYFLLVPVVNIVLAIAALVLGIMGARWREKTASVAAIVVGVINLALSLFVIGIWWIGFELLDSTFYYRQMPMGNSNYGWYEETIVPRQQMVMPTSDNQRNLNQQRNNNSKQMSDEEMWQRLPMQLPVDWK